MPSKREIPERKCKAARKREKQKANGKRKSTRLGLFSKNNDNVATPGPLFDELDEEFNFDCDPCPLHAQFNALDTAFKWGKCNYVNPPYSNIKSFVQRAVREWRKHKNMSVFLITLRPTTNYWRDYILPNATEVRILTSKVTFVGYDTPFPAALAIVVIGKTKGKSIGGESVGGVIHKRTYSYFYFWENPSL